MNNGLNPSNSPGRSPLPSAGNLPEVRYNRELAGTSFGEERPARALNPEERMQVIGEITNLTPGLGARVAELHARYPFHLSAADGNGQEVLEHFNRVLRVDASLGEAMLNRIYHPGHGSQQDHGTCGAESLLKVMNIYDKGEWARVVADLALNNTTTLRGGATLTVPEDARTMPADPGRPDTRTLFDRKIQSALMSFAAPENFKYDTNSDRWVDGLSGEVRESGYTLEKARDLLREFSNTSQTVANAVDLGTGLAGRLQAELREQGGFTYASLRWPCPADPGSSHAVALGNFEPELTAAGREIENDRVYFANPHGFTANRMDGHVLQNPPRRIEINDLGIQSMSIGDFKKFVNYVLVATEGALGAQTQLLAEREKLFGAKIDALAKEWAAQTVEKENFSLQLSRGLAMLLNHEVGQPADEGSVRFLLGDPHPVTRERIDAWAERLQQLASPDRTAEERATLLGRFIEYWSITRVETDRERGLFRDHLDPVVRKCEMSLERKLNSFLRDADDGARHEAQEWIRNRVAVALEAETRRSLSGLLAGGGDPKTGGRSGIGLVEKVSIMSLFKVQPSEAQWWTRVNPERIFSIVAPAGPPTATSASLPATIDGGWSYKTVAVSKAVCSGVAGVVALVGVPSVVDPSFWTCVGVPVGNVFLSAFFAGRERFDGGRFQKFAEGARPHPQLPKEIPPIRELIRGMAAAFHTHRASMSPGAPLDGPDSQYLQALYGGMRDLMELTLNEVDAATAKQRTAAVLARITRAHEATKPTELFHPKSALRSWGVDSSPLYAVMGGLARLFIP